jgi:hypothetical protein
MRWLVSGLRWLRSLALIAFATNAASGVGQELPSAAACHNQGLCQYPQGACPWGADGEHRAGYPQRIAWWAKPSDNGHYSGGYVGGGAAIGGDKMRSVDEGTFGWDYSGVVPLRRIWLNFTHGRRHQGGRGAYQSESRGATGLLEQEKRKPRSSWKDAACEASGADFYSVAGVNVTHLPEPSQPTVTFQ